MSRLPHAGKYWNEKRERWAHHWRCQPARRAVCQTKCKADKICAPIADNVADRTPYYQNYAAGFGQNVRCGNSQFQLPRVKRPLEPCSPYL